MNFWDSSALVPLCVRESRSDLVVGWYQQESHIYAWIFSSLEVISALCRKIREGTLDQLNYRAARQRLADIQETMTVVNTVAATKRRAERLLHLHPLRTADALQLAAALIATQEDPTGRLFTTFDTRLAEAASKEGFQVNTALHH